MKFLFIYSTFPRGTPKQCPAETTWETLLMTIQAKAYTILVRKYEVQQTVPPLQIMAVGSGCIRIIRYS